MIGTGFESELNIGKRNLCVKEKKEKGYRILQRLKFLRTIKFWISDFFKKKALPLC
jgi:hypothetical protein